MAARASAAARTSSGVIQTRRMPLARTIMRLAVERRSVLQLGVKGDRPAGDGNDAAAHGEHPVRLAHRFLEIALMSVSAAMSRLPKAWPRNSGLRRRVR